MTGFAELLAESQIVICCGTGGVGKTTTSAATALADLAAAAADDEARVADLTQSAPDAVLVRVPMLDDDVHDLDGLRRIADLLTADAPSATS